MIGKVRSLTSSTSQSIGKLLPTTILLPSSNKISDFLLQTHGPVNLFKYFTKWKVEETKILKKLRVTFTFTISFDGRLHGLFKIRKTINRYYKGFQTSLVYCWNYKYTLFFYKNQQNLRTKALIFAIRTKIRTKKGFFSSLGTEKRLF